MKTIVQRTQTTAATLVCAALTALVPNRVDADQLEVVPRISEPAAQSPSQDWKSHASQAKRAFVSTNYDLAESHLTSALEIARTLPQSEDKVIFSLNNLAIIHSKRGRFARAEPLLEEALNLTVAVHGENDPATAESLFNLAVVHLKIGRLDDAVAESERGATIDAKPARGKSPDFAACLAQASQLLAQRGDDLKAESALLLSVQAIRQQSGHEHPRVALGLASLGTLYRSQKRFAAAEQVLTESRAILEKQAAVSRSAMALVLNNLGSVYKDQNRLANAESLFGESVRLMEVELGTTHPQVAAGRLNLAIVSAALGKRESARNLFEEALSVFQRHLGPDHALTRECEKRLMEVATKSPATVAAAVPQESSDAASGKANQKVESTARR